MFDLNKRSGENSDKEEQREDGLQTEFYQLLKGRHQKQAGKFGRCDISKI